MPETRAIVPDQLVTPFMSLGLILNRPGSRRDYFCVIFPEGTLEGRVKKPGAQKSATIWRLPNGRLMLRWDPTERKPERTLTFFHRGFLLSMFPKGTQPELDNRFYAQPA